VGGLVGYIEARANDEVTLSHAHASGAVNTTYSGGGNVFAGGLVGRFKDSGDLTDVSAAGAVTSRSGDRVGGLIGQWQGDHHARSVTNATATGDVDSPGAYVAGLIGYHHVGNQLTNVSAAGDVTAVGQRVGGLVGYTEASITDATASGDVTSDSGNGVGGLVGDLYARQSRASVENVRASGDVSAAGKDVGDSSGTVHAPSNYQIRMTDAHRHR
jgi:The GLUG motif.